MASFVSLVDQLLAQLIQGLPGLLSNVGNLGSEIVQNELGPVGSIGGRERSGTSRAVGEMGFGHSFAPIAQFNAVLNAASG